MQKEADATMRLIDVQEAIDELPEPKIGVPYQVLQKMDGMGHIYWLYEMDEYIMPQYRKGLRRLVDRRTKKPYSEGIQVGRAYVFARSEHGVFHREFVPSPKAA